jgi:hypothetical protein
MSGLELQGELAVRRPDMPVILITAFPEERIRKCAAPRTMAFMASVLDYDAAATPRSLQVGASIGVDFHADCDLDDARCFPSHDVSPWGGMHMSRNLWMGSM